MVVGRGDEEYVAHLAGELLSTDVRVGDNVLFDSRAGVATELLPKEEVEEPVLEEIPDVSYEDIGGLEGQSIRSAMRSSCRSSTRSCSPSTSSRRPRECCCTGPPAAGRR